MSRKILLASASPRRSALLEQIGVAHEIRATDVDESAHARGDSRSAGPAPCARQGRGGRNARAPGCRCSGPIPSWSWMAWSSASRVDAADGMRMLCALGGRTHHVLTAVALALPGTVAEALQRHRRDDAGDLRRGGPGLLG